MRPSFPVLVCVLVCGLAVSVNASLFDAASIPPELRVNANVVIRSSHVSYAMKSASKALIRCHRIITVLSGRGLSSANVVIYYDLSSKVLSFHGSLYGKNGELLSHLDKSDLKDYSSVSEGSLYTDDRCKVFFPPMNTFPFTFEYEFEKEVTDFLNYPTWFPQDDYNQSVESSSFSLSFPGDAQPRYKQVNLSDPPAIFRDKSGTVLEWTVRSLPARDEEPYSPALSDMVPAVHTAPSGITYGGYEGTMATWKDLGGFFYRLNSDRQDLSPQTVALVRRLIDTIPGEQARIRALYGYMQSKTRYVSVQIGIGGTRPEPASTVDKKGYGDCKALVNYMKCLLDAAGIRSFYTLVKAGDDHPDILEDFPSNQFNHVILCVPSAADTTWLECTSQDCPFGFLGAFTDDRPVLLITPDGGVMTRTPRYSEDDNKYFRTVEVTLDSSGNGSAQITNVYRGLEYSRLGGLPQLPFTEQKKALENRLGVSGCKVLSVAYILDKNPIPAAVEKISVYLPAEAVVSGNRIFLPLSLPGFLPEHPKRSENRKSPFVLRRDAEFADSTTFILPAGCQVESLPKPQSASSIYGSYQASSTVTSHGILSARRAELHEGQYPPDQFNLFVDYRKQVSKSIREKAILVRPE
jgi:hypothetical protein